MEIRCRCCLGSKTNSYIPLTSSFLDIQKTILEVVNSISSCKINLTQGLPSEICKSCFEKLNVTFNFLTLIKQSQKCLEEVMKQVEFENEKDPEEDCQEKIIIVNESDVSEFVQTESSDELVYSSAAELVNEFKIEPLNSDLQPIYSKLNPESKQNVILMTVEDVLKYEKEAEDEVSTRNSQPRKRKKITGVFKCNICNSIFNSDLCLYSHKYRMHNPNWKEKFKCKICLLECRTASALNHHKTKHESEYFECHMCSKRYRIKQLLVAHIRNKHDPRVKHKHLCQTCGKCCNSATALRYHLKRHLNVRNYMCRYCGFKSLVETAMKRHERTHTGERPYICKFCGKTFSGGTEKIKHEHIHQGILPHKCTYCEKRFIQAHNMKVHMLQHEGDFSCYICNKSFIDETVLKFHYRYKHKINLQEEKGEEEKQE